MAIFTGCQCLWRTLMQGVIQEHVHRFNPKYHFSKLHTCSCFRNQIRSQQHVHEPDFTHPWFCLPLCINVHKICLSFQDYNGLFLLKCNFPLCREQSSSALFFQYNTQLGPPYYILVDTNFINFSIKNKLDIVKSMMDCLYAKCKIVCISPNYMHMY